MHFIHSVRFKIIYTYIAIIIVMIMFLNTYPLMISQNLIVNSKQNDLLASASMISNSLSGLEFLDEKSVRLVMDVLGVEGSSRVIILDERCMVSYDNSVTDNLSGRFFLTSGVTTAMDGMDIFRCVYRDGAFNSYAMVPVAFSDRIIGVVYLYEYDSEQADMLIQTQRSILNVSIAIFIVVSALGLMFSNYLTRRITELLNAIRSVREGNYDHRAELKGKDELSRLAVEFNELSGRLEITESLRREFISNASHELKTPLASIRLLTDSILHTGEMKISDIREFVSDIAHEIDRLSRLTEKLLILSRLEAAIEPPEERVDIGSIIEKSVKMLSPLAKQNDIEIIMSAKNDLMVIGEYDSVYQIVYNLVENAVKYSPSCGVVNVYLYDRNGEAHFLVDDEGAGIPEVDRSRIFDRFYRVDKARSRNTGGSGLGLSIAQRAAELCGGMIYVEPRDTNGTRFRVVFRKV